MLSQSISPVLVAVLPVVSAIANPQISSAVKAASASSAISSSYSSLLSSYTSAVAASFSSHSSLPSATTTGAVESVVTATAIPVLPPGPDATSYVNLDGKLQADQPAPYTPAGGLDTNGSEPVYTVQSDFDFESLSLAIYQEYIELDLFQHALDQFSDEEFDAAGIDADGRFLIHFMAEQEVGHAKLLANLLGPKAPVQCSYQYPFSTVPEWIDFSQKLTKFGESGVFGFLKHLNSGPAAQLLQQSISTESRQQMIFRQFEGLFPMPVWFEAGIPQSWAWTLISPYIASCPENQTRVVWQNFPSLTIENQPNPYRLNPNATGINETISSVPESEACNTTTECGAGITHNRTALSFPGRTVQLSWEEPGVLVGPNQSYVTNTTAGSPKFVMWVSQLNSTVTALTDFGNNTGTTIQPNMNTFDNATDPVVNGTMFIALLDANVTVTPYNISMINPHVVAGPAIYQAG